MYMAWFGRLIWFGAGAFVALVLIIIISIILNDIDGF